MRSFCYAITDPIGLHMTPGGKLVALVKTLDSRVTISAGGSAVDAGKLLRIVSLGITTGTQVTVPIEGGDEEASYRKLYTFFAAEL